MSVRTIQPIGLFYRGEVPVVGSSPKDPTHSGIMGVKLAERLKEVGVDVVLVHPGESDAQVQGLDGIFDRSVIEIKGPH